MDTVWSTWASTASAAAFAAAKGERPLAGHVVSKIDMCTGRECMIVSLKRN